MRNVFPKSFWLTMMILMIVASANVPVWGATITVINPSFEVDNPPGPGWGREPTYGDWNTIASGWDIAGFAGTFIPNSYAYTAIPYGTHVAFAESVGSALSQTTGALLTAGYTYTLKVAVGHRLPYIEGGSWPFPGYHVQLLAGDNVLEDLITPVTPTGGHFNMVTLTYTATNSNPWLGQPLGIRLISNGSQTNFDNVSLDGAPVPVPGTLVLLASGLLPLLGWRRYRG